MNKSNKIGLFLFGALLFACAGRLHAQQAMSLDGVIVQAAKDMEAYLSAEAKLAVLNFTSTAEAFSNYVIEELTGALVMNRKVTVIDRKSLDLIRKEMNLQLSGNVSDDLAQAIGKQLGAQTIVTGSLTNLGDIYRFRVKVINVETARIEAQFSYNLGNNQQVVFLLNGNQQNTPPVDSVQGQVDPKSLQTTATYKIGDTGPAGGIVFYDKGNSSGGWQYMEVSPSALGKAQWGASYKNVRTDTAIGMGKRNTLILVDFLKSSEESERAAQLCVAYKGGGFTDWFLPSKDELNAVYTNLVESYLVIDMGLTGWTDTHWSSSQGSDHPTSDDAWSQRFSSGHQYYNFDSRKTTEYSVRAVRVF
ncbi:MAG: DUF1566 domain-containing protein [Treponema sp.]|jgi:TolB-like protein|nr:DUF1566 domain-containing protein [Treponema sp.]